MFQSLNRRHVLGGLPALLAGLHAVPGIAEPPPETTVIRLGTPEVACTAPLYLAKELLRQEGFSEVRYVPWSETITVASGDVDLDMWAACDYLPLMDSGKPMTVLAGIHSGCFELRAGDDIQSVADLRGKRVAVSTPLGVSTDHLLVSAMASYVGLDPATEITWITNPSVSQAELFVRGEVDAFVGFPPQPSLPCPRDTGHVVVSIAQDRPWSNYFCCMAVANSNFLSNNPVAAKRALRALLKATDLCHQQPERAAQRMADFGYSRDCALMILNDARYGLWRDYDPEDTVRFYALRLHEAGLIKKTPDEIISGFTDWHFLDEIKRELKT